METAVVKATDILLSQSEEILADKENLIAKSVIDGMRNFLSIASVVLLNKNKKLSEIQRQGISSNLTNVLFYAGCLSHLCDVDPYIFNDEALEEFSTTFPDIFKIDSVLASTQGLRAFQDILEEHFTYGEENFTGENEEESQVLDLEEEETSPYEQALAEIFSYAIILAKNFDLDTDTLVYNIKNINKI